MRDSFDAGFEIVVGLEGAPTNDPADPGGYTKYGIAQKYNPDIDVRLLTLEVAKNLYLKRYWIPAGCDAAGFPLDICLFDGQVNPQDDKSLPGKGNAELMALAPENWQDFLLLRANRYLRCSAPKYVSGHIARIVRLHHNIKGLTGHKIL
jgi:hypothetical protein